MSTPEMMDAIPIEFEEGEFHFHFHGKLSDNEAEVNAFWPKIQLNNEWHQSVFTIEFHLENQTLLLSSHFMMSVPDQIQPLEIFPGDEIFVNITYDAEIKTFYVDTLPRSLTLPDDRSIAFELDTNDEFAILSKLALRGAMTFSYAGFIPVGSVAAVDIGTVITLTCEEGWALDGKDYGPQTQEMSCGEGGVFVEPGEWLPCLECT